ncbi:MAG: hypothetical protein WC426_14050 [Sulfuriferula sp.]
MKQVFQKALSLLFGTDDTVVTHQSIKKRPLKELTERELISLESQIGSQLFGPADRGVRREFFNVDKQNWIWHEEHTDASGKVHSMTTRYEIQPQGILKVRVGEPYVFLEGQELQNLLLATQMYHERVMRNVYNRDPKTGKLVE